MLGVEPRPIPAYNSCGLGLMEDFGALAAEAETLLSGGFRAVELRLGCPTLERDIAAVRAVRKRIGDTVHLMVDYDQALSVDEAMARGPLWMRKIFIGWRSRSATTTIPVPPRWRALKVPIQIGENFSLPAAMVIAIEQGAADYVMPDLERIGGVTGWRQAAELTAINRVQMSSHLFPEVSAHLLAATPTCHFLEYVVWANVLVQEPLVIADGHAVVPQRPGNGMVWDRQAFERYRMR